MPERTPITVILNSPKEKALVEEIAHQRGLSRSAFCREAILTETLEAVEGITDPDPNETETEEAVDAR